MEVLKETVTLDVVNSVLEVPVTFGQISPQQVLYQRLELATEVNDDVFLPIKAFRVARLRVNDLPVNVHGVLILEGREAGQHLINQNANRPPVDGLPVALVSSISGAMYSGVPQIV